MSKDRNIDDAELAKISGAGDVQEKELADAGGGSTADKDDLKQAPSGGATIGGADNTSTAGGTGGNQNLSE